MSEHTLVVVPRTYDTVIACLECGEHFRLKYGELPKHDGTPSITAADLTAWTAEHIASLAAEEPAAPPEPEPTTPYGWCSQHGRADGCPGTIPAAPPATPPEPERDWSELERVQPWETER